MLPRVLVCLALGTAFLAGCGAKKDLDTLCRIADEVEQDASIPDEHKMLVVMQRLEAAEPGEAMRNTTTAMATVAADQRWHILVRGAEEMGVPNWQCEPMKRLLTPTAPTPAAEPQ